MTMLVTKNTKNNTIAQKIIQCIVNKNHTYNHLMKHSVSHYKSFHFHQDFYCILLLMNQLFFVYIYNFYNLSILLCHMIYRIHNYSY